MCGNTRGQSATANLKAALKQLIHSAIYSLSRTSQADLSRASTENKGNVQIAFLKSRVNVSLSRIFAFYIDKTNPTALTTQFLTENTGVASRTCHVRPQRADTTFFLEIFFSTSPVALIAVITAASWRRAPVT